ncbi:STAS domain-containing protein [Streptomyces scabiei]|uniref:STAS domain-containing protein n=1 Tax=Streptomyces scabiei TaxID=1930 RepID=UPI002D21E8D7|nr:STAS domain-containing protein [Streptomyces scabiei]
MIDLSQVDFFGCSGLKLVHRARAWLLDQGGELRLVCPSVSGRLAEGVSPAGLEARPVGRGACP